MLMSALGVCGWLFANAGVGPSRLFLLQCFGRIADRAMSMWFRLRDCAQLRWDPCRVPLEVAVRTGPCSLGSLHVLCTVVFGSIRRLCTAWSHGLMCTMPTRLAGLPSSWGPAR